MFTGIVEELGEVARIERSVGSARLAVRGPLVTSDAVRGGSVAVDGCCLTVAELAADTFVADVMQETLDRTSLGALRVGDPVNLERPVSLASRLGGHLVQGHVDATATLLDRVPGDGWELVRFSLPTPLARYVVPKGSIAVDGVSLTVVEAGVEHFTVSLIPATLESTTLGRKPSGASVNLEVDVLAKYVERLLQHGSTAPAAATTDTAERAG